MVVDDNSLDNLAGVRIIRVIRWDFKRNSATCRDFNPGIFRDIPAQFFSDFFRAQTSNPFQCDQRGILLVLDSHFVCHDDSSFLF